MKIGGRARVSLRQRNHAPVRKLELLAVSEAPGLHRLTRDSSRRERVAVVARLLSTESQNRIGCQNRIACQNRSRSHSRYRSRSHRIHTHRSHSRRIRTDSHSRTRSNRTGTHSRNILDIPSPTTLESQNHQ